MLTMQNISSLQSFRSMDADRSGGLSLTEFTNGKAFGTAGLRSAITQTSAKAVFTKFDADKNVYIIGSTPAEEVPIAEARATAVGRSAGG